MKNETSQSTAQSHEVAPAVEQQIRSHLDLLGHDRLGVTELRVFDPLPHVAYAESTDVVVRLCREMDGRTFGIYVGVQPRPAHLFDLAPNRWTASRGGRDGNCARDSDVEYVTAVFFDLDVVSPERVTGHPASDEELQRSLQAARFLAQQDGLVGHSTICCSGNGHYVLAPVVAVSVGSDEIADKFRCFCQELEARVAHRIAGVRIDPVYNMSRVMRLMGTVNQKGKPAPGRPYRRAACVTEPVPARSIALHHMILNADPGQSAAAGQELPTGLRCDLKKIHRCEFIQWCRRRPLEVSEPLWFALLTNLARLHGGIQLAHEISALDRFRYDYAETQRVIERILGQGYMPVSCRTIMSPAMGRPGRGVFRCSRIQGCPAKAPMYLAATHTVYER
jgi:hypothetical protein